MISLEEQRDAQAYAADQLRALVDNGASVTVTPETELQMGFGACLTGRLRALGSAPSLGSDVESSLGSDMFTNMRMALQAQRALDMAVGHITTRSTFGQLISDRQAVQFMLADCAEQLYIGRLMLLHIAYKA